MPQQGLWDSGSFRVPDEPSAVLSSLPLPHSQVLIRAPLFCFHDSTEDLPFKLCRERPELLISSPVEPMLSELCADALYMGRRGSANSPVPQDSVFPLLLSDGYSSAWGII